MEPQDTPTGHGGGANADPPPTEAGLTLPAQLDTAAAEPLRGLLQDRLLLGQPLALAAGGVERVSTLCLQVLAAAARDARARGLGFALVTPSAALAEAIALLGLHRDIVG